MKIILPKVVFAVPSGAGIFDDCEVIKAKGGNLPG